MLTCARETGQGNDLLAQMRGSSRLFESVVISLSHRERVGVRD
jgi:hypothetical protein